MKSKPPCTEAKSKKELVHATSDDAGSQLLPDGNVIEGSENIAKLFTDRELMKDSIFTRCRVNPTASFISWKSISAEGENQSKYQPKPPKQVRSIKQRRDGLFKNSK